MNKQTRQYLNELETKYFELVWMMRNITSKKPKLLREIEEKYPKEVSDLMSDASGFEHGFNSGCLAVLRFVLTAIDKSKFGGLEQAKNGFPSLDT